MAMLLRGKEIADQIKQEIKNDVATLRAWGVAPKLAAILVGGDKSSVVYAQAKERVCGLLGIEFLLYRLPGDVSEQDLVGLIRSLNEDPQTHGIMIELPLPRHLDKARVLESVSPLKDVDGVHPINRGHLMAGTVGLYPATPQSCIAIMRLNGIEIEGKHAVVVGRGETVGKPLISLLLQQNATVTVCHTRTRDIGRLTRQADILVAAAGRAGLITGAMVREGAVVVDAGINPTESGICGDVDFESVERVAAAITPVPGGVGSLTTAFIMQNLLQAIELQQVSRMEAVR
ncbi:MAG: bifunctional 5,10-methylenetetrahydrofolate dehydrogenase/5,10-methenyltetrahydrofolate cyclohydrolase [Desulforudis sp.]|nr:MAG: bifunctional 5,10-methylenetetrahydrofolate dehydrogenase/5,10-methenyltetrahydrofolate cyclohydrolase [Desulforudis sp.]